MNFLHLFRPLGTNPKVDFSLLHLLNQRSIELDNPMKNFHSFEITIEGRPDVRTTWDIQSFKAARPRI